MEHTKVFTDNAPAAIGPYSQAVKLGDLVFCSGQLAIDPKTGVLEGDTAAQTKKLLTNLQAVLQKAGSDLDKVVKTTVFLKNMGDFAEFNKVYAEFFKENPPARSAVEVAALPKGALVEIEAIAHI